MALSACKDDALVQGSDGKDVVANTVEDQIFKGRLGNDVYSYLMSDVWNRSFELVRHIGQFGQFLSVWLPFAISVGAGQMKFLR